MSRSRAPVHTPAQATHHLDLTQATHQIKNYKMNSSGSVTSVHTLDGVGEYACVVHSL